MRSRAAPLQAFAANWGWQEIETDWRKVIECDGMAWMAIPFQLINHGPGGKLGSRTHREANSASN